jgi:hypothetical protein
VNIGSDGDRRIRRASMTRLWDPPFASQSQRILRPARRVGSLPLRVSAGPGDGPLGEALSELGFGLLFTRRFRRGRDALHEGVELMRRAGYSPGFLIRALNKKALV